MAVGTGLNFEFYSADITITGIELSAAMLAIARQRATDFGLRVDLHEGDAQAMPFDSNSFAQAVACEGCPPLAELFERDEKAGAGCSCARSACRRGRSTPLASSPTPRWAGPYPCGSGLETTPR